MPHEDPSNNPTFSSQPQMKELTVEQSKLLTYIVFKKTEKRTNGLGLSVIQVF